MQYMQQEEVGIEIVQQDDLITSQCSIQTPAHLIQRKIVQIIQQTYSLFSSAPL